MIHSVVPILMEVRKITIQELIEKTGMDEATIKKSRFDTIGNRRLESLYKIAKALDVRLDLLFIKCSS